MNPSAIKTQQGFKLLQLGETGSTKTSRALDALRYGPVKIFDIDNKVKELVDSNPTKYPDSMIDVVSIGQGATETLVRTYDEVMSVVQALSRDCNAGKNTFATVIFDTISEFQPKVKQKAADSAKTTVDLFTFKDWGNVLTFNLNLIYALLALPCNVIVNGHLQKEKNVFDQTTLAADLIGKAANEIPRKFNEQHFIRLVNSKATVFGKPQPQMETVKTLRPATMLETNGAFKIWDLSIFDGVAFKIAGPK